MDTSSKIHNFAVFRLNTCFQANVIYLLVFVVTLYQSAIVISHFLSIGSLIWWNIVVHKSIKNPCVVLYGGLVSMVLKLLLEKCNWRNAFVTLSVICWRYKKFVQKQECGFTLWFIADSSFQSSETAFNLEYCH